MDRSFATFRPTLISGFTRPDAGPLVPDRSIHPFSWQLVHENSGVDLTLMVPCFNEEGNVQGALDSAREALRGLNLTYEFIVIDDCSTDGTSEKVLEYKKRHPDEPVWLFRNEINQGFARNFTLGAFMAHGKYYRVLFGDDNEPMEALRPLFELAGQRDIIIPYHPHVPTKHVLRRILSRTYTGLINLLSGYQLHYYNGGPVFRTSDVLCWHVEVTGFGFQAEILTVILNTGVGYMEVATPAHERESGASSALTLHNLLSVAHTLLNITLRRLRLAWFGR